MDMLTSVCVHVAKMCVIKSGTCTIIASRTHVSVVQDSQAAAALFDVGGCFEALSARAGRAGGFSWFKPYI